METIETIYITLATLAGVWLLIGILNPKSRFNK